MERNGSTQTIYCDGIRENIMWRTKCIARSGGCGLYINCVLRILPVAEVYEWPRNKRKYNKSKGNLIHVAISGARKISIEKIIFPHNLNT
jgi:hypothetical protein